MSQDPTPETRTPSRTTRRWLVPGAALALAVSAIQLLFMFCLSYPPLHAAPQHVPLGLVGPEAAVQQVGARLAAVGQDAFDITSYPDIDAARAAIWNRDAYGAVSVGPDGASVLVSSAANASVANMLTTLAAGLSSTTTTPVEDVVPASTDDPNGSGFLATALPLTLLSLALGIGVALLEKRPGYAAGWIAVAAATTAVFASWIAHTMGTFTGSYGGTLTILFLLVFGIAITSAGLTRLGPAGRALDLVFALLLLCLGIPSAGAIVPAVFLVQPWRALGPLLPPGAAVDALRGINYFNGAATTGPLWILSAWAAAGLALVLVPNLVSHRQPHPLATAAPVSTK